MSTRRRTGRLAAMIMDARPSTLAAPPMSFFISAIELPGLRLRPPVSKHTPLPTSVTLGWLSLPPDEVEQARRAQRGAANGVDHREVLFKQLISRGHFQTGSMGIDQTAGDRFQFVRPHVIGRDVDEVTCQIGALDLPQNIFAINTLRPVELRQRRGVFLVAIKTVAAQMPGESCQKQGLRIITEGFGVGEMIAPGGQLHRQQARQQRRGGFATTLAKAKKNGHRTGHQAQE